MVAIAVAGACVLGACGKNGSKSVATTTVATAPTTTAAPTIVFPPTSLRVEGFSPGVNQAGFYPAATVNVVACAGPSGGPAAVSFTIPPGGPGTPARTAMTVATTAVVTTGRAEVRDHAGRVLYAATDASLKPADHGSLVLSMTNVAGSDSDGRRVAAGAVNVSGDYLCPSH